MKSKRHLKLIGGRFSSDAATSPAPFQNILFAEISNGVEALSPGLARDRRAYPGPQKMDQP
ncbi:MAG: hypothetical protein IPK15_07655 [Verrucomicrobia bacterium]|nr:hypothetical protein [Verrucomicrobiota bacterium]